MSCRGVFQLKKLHLQYCDYGGSSKGVREFLNSVYVKEFMEKNPQIEFKFFNKRGAHPYITATYINGFMKDQSLRNCDLQGVLNEFFRVRNSFGRKHITHNGKKVYGVTPSVQGGWRHNLWNNYPRHEFEYIREIPVFDKEFIVSNKDPVIEGRKINTRDPVTQIFRAKSVNDK